MKFLVVRLQVTFRGHLRSFHKNMAKKIIEGYIDLKTGKFIQYSPPVPNKVLPTPELSSEKFWWEETPKNIDMANTGGVRALIPQTNVPFSGNWGENSPKGTNGQIVEAANGKWIYDESSKKWNKMGISEKGQTIVPPSPTLPPTVSQPTGTVVIPPSTTPTIPNQPTNPANNLVDYKNTLNQAVQLARDKRNELMLRFMGTVAPSGTMAASDFNSILANMNKASDITTEKALEQTTPIYDTISVDGDIYEIQKDPASKQIIGEPKLIKKSSGKVLTTSEKESQLRAQASDAFESVKGEDGYISPEDWRILRAKWLQQGGLLKDFNDNFSVYANPSRLQDYNLD